jgi:DNA-binding NarL/FixJ family response regulator
LEFIAWIHSYYLSASLRSPGIIVCSDNDSETAMRQAFDAGISSFIGRKESAADLDKALWSAARNIRYIPKRLVDKINIVCALTKQLSARERKIFELVQLGYDNLTVAKDLGIKNHSVENHITNIFAKMDVADRETLMCL